MQTLKGNSALVTQGSLIALNFFVILISIEKNNNIRAVQAETSKFGSLSFDQGVQIVINPSSVVYVPEPIRTPSDSILH